jgi:glycosyltransferase involved in cell wall biosynthesis
VEPGDPAALAAAIDAILADRVLSARLSANAGERAGAYDLQRVGAEVAELYRALARERATPRRRG